MIGGTSSQVTCVAFTSASDAVFFPASLNVSSRHRARSLSEYSMERVTPAAGASRVDKFAALKAARQGQSARGNTRHDVYRVMISQASWPVVLLTGGR